MSSPAVEPLATFGDVLARLESAGLDYMVVGSVASIIYGEPRMTADMDVVVELLPQEARRIAAIFPEDEFYCPPREVIVAEVLSRGQFNLLSHATGLKVDMLIRKASPHGCEEFARRRRTSLWPGFDVWVAAPEDVIIKKLDYYREGGSEKHLRDIRGIVAQTDLDRAYLDRWVAELGLDRQWRLAST